MSVLTRERGFVVDPDEGVIIISGTSTLLSSSRGHCFVFNYSTGSQLKHYVESDNSGFPYHGLIYPCVCNGKIYGTLIYTALYDQAERRGLVIIDMSNDTVRYSRPDLGHPG